MRKEAKKMEKTPKENLVKRVFYSPYAIVVVLMLAVLGLLAYSRFLIKANTVYTYSGYTEDFSFLGGTIYEGLHVNYFGDSKVIYKGKDVEVYDFEAGYYLKEDEEYIPISVIEHFNSADEEDEKKGASLKEIVMNMSYSFTETHKEAKYLSSENLANLDNLVFRVFGKDKKGTDYSVEVPMVVEKITK